MMYVVIGSVLLLFALFIVLLCSPKQSESGQELVSGGSSEDYFWKIHWTEVPIERCRQKLNELEYEWRQTKSVSAFNELLKLLDSERRQLDRIAARRHAPRHGGNCLMKVSVENGAAGFGTN